VTRAVERAVAAGAEAIDGCFEAEIAPALLRMPEEVPPIGPAARRVPLRLQRTPVVPMRGHQAGHLGLDREAREALHVLERDLPGGSTTLELAWFAADGRRSLAEIADCLADEGAPVEIDALARYFELTLAMGLSGWAAPGEG
jgi:hypothetical protein